MAVEYLTFGRDSEFLVQSVVLSSLFVLAGRLWKIPQELAAMSGDTAPRGLAVLCAVTTVVVGVVVYLSGCRTYSPRFNRLRHCLVATVFHVVLGSIVVGSFAVVIVEAFSLTVSGSFATLCLSIFFLGVLYALAVTAWHYHRVLSVEYDATAFEGAAASLLDALENVETVGEISDARIQSVADAIDDLSAATIQPKLSDEHRLNTSISSLHSEFEDADDLDRELILRGEQRDGSPIDDDLESLHQTLFALRDDLEVVTE